MQVFFFRTVASRPEAAKSAAVFMLNTSLGLQYPVDALPAASDVASGALEGFGDIEFKKSKGESRCACDSVNAGLVQGHSAGGFGAAPDGAFSFMKENGEYDASMLAESNRRNEKGDVGRLGRNPRSRQRTDMTDFVDRHTCSLQRSGKTEKGWKRNRVMKGVM